MLCSTFKGVLPSDLFEKYDCEGGFIKLEYDLLIAAEISDRITEQTEKSSNESSSRRAKRAVAKRNQNREKMTSQTMNDWIKGE
jgi:hypothetical protein